MKKFNMFAMLGFALLATASLSACGSEYQLETQEQKMAEFGALKYASAEGGKFTSCSGQDSDGDSYVTCTIKDGQNVTVELLCSYKTEGCKRKSA
jgi:hypothetical protein